jgi:hypothetical protein
MRRAILTLLGLSLLAALPVAAKDGEYLFDTLKKPAYRASWSALIRSKRTDSWLVSFARTKNGPCTPSKTVRVGGIAYQAQTVCEAHNCGGNFFAVFFAPGGKKAWGVYLHDGKNEQFFGAPSGDLKTALLKFAHSPE